MRKHQQAQVGDRFKFFIQPDGAVFVLPRIPMSTLKGTVPALGKPVSIAEMNAAVETGATERFR